MRKFLLGFAIAIVATCAPAFAGSPTIVTLVDGFGTGVGSTARANTPSGASTGSYGAPNSSWGVGNGWIDTVGNPTGATPGTGCNIAATYASCTTLSKFQFLEQDSFYTATPNQAISATIPSMLANSANYTWFVSLRGQPNTDCYALVYSNGSLQLNKITGGNVTVTQLTTQSSITPTAGHVIVLKMTATGDGSTTTTLTGTMTDTTSSTQLGSITATDSGTTYSTQELQSGGRAGLGDYFTTGTAQWSQVTLYSDTALAAPVVYLGFGPADSLTYGLSTTLQTVPDVICRTMNVIQTAYHYVPVNMGFSGSTTANWQNGASTGYLAAAIQNYNALGVKFIFTTLGDNDSFQNVSAATWLSNYNAMITYLKSQVPNTTVLFNFPPYLDWVRFNFATSGSTGSGGSASAAAIALANTYNYAGLTNVVLGDTISRQTFQTVDYFGITDGAHPSDQGATLLAFQWIMQYLKATNQIGNPTTSTITFVGH